MHPKTSTPRALVVVRADEHGVEYRAWVGSAQGVSETPPPNLAGAPSDIVRWAADHFESEGVLCLPGTHRYAADFGRSLAFAGWRGTPPDTIAEYGFGLYYKHGMRSITTVGFPQLWDEARVPLMAGKPAGKTLALLLATYHHLTGVAWRGTPGLSGCAYLREHVKPEEGEPIWRWDNAPDAPFYGVADLNWMREPTPAEQAQPFVHTFDVRGMHLAAASGAIVGWGLPRPTDPGKGGEQGASLHHIVVTPDMTDGRMRPPLLPAARVVEGRAWVTGPVLDYLTRDRGLSVAVERSWAYPVAGRYLRGWADQLRDALTNRLVPAGSGMELALKQTYRETVGMLGKPGGRIYRPDWRLTILDLARVNLLRKVDRAWVFAGVLPMEVVTDSLTYAYESADPAMLAAALRVKEGVYGSLRATGSMPMADYLDPLTGRVGAPQGAAGPISEVPAPPANPKDPAYRVTLPGVTR